MKAIRLACMIAFLLLPVCVFAQEKWETPRVDTEQNLEGLSLAELRILRNTVFAVHGFEFESKDLQSYFWNQPWYQKIRRSMEKDGKKFSRDSLTGKEKNFIKRVKALETRIAEEAKKKKRPGQLYNYSLLANVMQFPKPEKKARRMIEDNGFVVQPAAHEQFFNVYEDNDYRMIPSFITSDSVLQLYHVFFDFSLRDVEKNKLLPAAVSLTGQLFDRARSTFKRSKVPQIKEAAAFLMTYFGVAHGLFTGKTPNLAGSPGKRMNAELAMIRAHKGRELSNLTGDKMDYSQYIPRGHYTRSDELKRYFLGMMWLGRVYFSLKRDDQLRAALLMTYYLLYYQNRNTDFLTGPLMVLWETIYEPTVFFVGKADDLSPHHVRQAMASVYGKEVFKAKTFADGPKLDQVRKALVKLNPQRIKTTHIDMPNTGIRFMGQRHIPDSEILQRLIKFPDRSFPKGLDLFAVFGNPEAAELLDQHYKEPEKWSGYLPERNKLKNEFDALAKSAWEQNLYWSWLDSLRVLLEPSTGKTTPPFSTTKAWRLKQLHTALASWAELRHDTILYAKPFGAECGGGDEPPKTRGYVEPVPGFFARLRKLVGQTRDGLAGRRLLTTGFDQVAKQMDDLLTFLETVARKQLTGEKVTEKEYEQIRLYGSVLGYLTTQLLTDFGTPHWYEVQGPDRSVAVIADIGTVQSTALEEGVGTADEIFVVVEFEGVPTLTRGAVFSYYEFTWPASDRLTDEKWQKMLKEDKAPPRPDWVQRFLFPKSCPKMPDVLFYSSGC